MSKKSPSRRRAKSYRKSIILPLLLSARGENSKREYCLIKWHFEHFLGQVSFIQSSTSWWGTCFWHRDDVPKARRQEVYSLDMNTCGIPFLVGVRFPKGTSPHHEILFYLYWLSKMSSIKHSDIFRQALNFCAHSVSRKIAVSIDFMTMRICRNHKN